jgi:hypothetical protein
MPSTQSTTESHPPALLELPTVLLLGKPRGYRQQDFRLFSEETEEEKTGSI